MRTIGWDQSLNHGAGIMLDDDAAIVDWWVTTTRVGDLVPQTRGHVQVAPVQIRSGKAKIADLHTFGIARLRYLDDWFGEVCERPSMAVDGKYFAVEDYAQAAKGPTHQIGEAGGLLRLRLLWSGAVRLYNTMDLKLFATNRGNAKKDEELRPAVLATYAGTDFAQLVATLLEREVSNDVVGDMVDAYVLARLLMTELRLRSGVERMQDLGEGPRRVFLRATEKQRVNVLDRPFVTAEGTATTR